MRLDQLLPKDQGSEIRARREKFDKMETADAKYAACMDRLQPFLHNTLTEGFAWAESGTCRASVEKRMYLDQSGPHHRKWLADTVRFRLM